MEQDCAGKGGGLGAYGQLRSNLFRPAQTAPNWFVTPERARQPPVFATALETPFQPLSSSNEPVPSFELHMSPRTTRKSLYTSGLPVLPT